MNFELMYKLLKYLIQGIIIYVLFKYVPHDPMKDKDILLITIIVLLAYAVLENFMHMYNKNNNSHQQLVNHEEIPTQCQSYCSTQQTDGQQVDQQHEHMQSVSSTVQPSVASPSVASPSVASPSVASPSVSAESQSSSEQTNTIQPVNKNNQGVGAETLSINPASATYNAVSQSGHHLAYNYADYNSLPASGGVTTGGFENGYSFLPPSQWYPVPPHPPVCIPEKQCPVCPVYTNVETMDLLEWNAWKAPQTNAQVPIVH